MRATLIATPVLACLGLAVWWTPAERETTAPADPPAAASSDLAYAWPAGTGYRYRLAFDSTTTVARFGRTQNRALPTLGGAFHLAGQMELRSHGVIDGQTRLALRLTQLDRPAIRLLDRDLLTDATQIETHLLRDTAWLSVDPRGRVTQLSFAPDASHLFRNVAQLLVSETWFPLGAGTRWTTIARTQHGEAETLTTRVDATLRRQRTRYQHLQAADTPWTATVDALATARVEPDGPLLTATGHETLHARDARGVERLTANTRFELALIERFQFGATPLPTDLIAYAPGESSERADAWDQHIRQRIAGLTGAMMLETLKTHGRFGKVPDHERFLWRAVALLGEEPALCGQLAALFESPRMTQKGRLLILDLLASTGTAAAQSALRAALDSRVAEASPDYGLMYQRLSLVQRPDANTVAMAQARYGNPGPEGFGAAAYALGSVARKAPSAAVAEAIGARLERDLLDLEPHEAEKRRTLIYALGNAAAGAETVRAYVQSADPALRYAAAAALRHQRDPTNRAALVELTGDAEHGVARRAMRSLADADLSAAELRRLYALVRTRAMPEMSYPALVNLLTPYLEDPVGAAILRHILTQTLKDARIKGRIRALLGEA